MWIAAGPGSFISGVKTLRPRTIRSGVVMIGNKLAQKFFQEILRDATTIVRGRAHVINRRNFAGELFASSANHGVVQPLPSKHGFCSSGAENSGSNASKRDASISNLVLVPQRSTGKADFRDGLRVASTHLPVILLPATHCSWQPDSVHRAAGPSIYSPGESYGK